MATSPTPKSCIQGANIAIDAELVSLPRKMSFGLEMKIQAIDPSRMYGEVLIPSPRPFPFNLIKRPRRLPSGLLFRYKLSLSEKGGEIERTIDGMPVVVIYSIERVIAGIVIPRFMKSLHNLYVFLALAGMAYSLFQYIF